MMKKKHIKDPGSAITHFIGMLMAIFAAFPLLIKAAHEPSRIYLISLAIYAVSLIFLYAASTTYHTFDFSERVVAISRKRSVPTIGYLMCQKCPACSSCSTSASEREVLHTGHQLMILEPL